MNDIEKIEKLLKQIAAGSILDIATGGGDFIYSLQESFKSYKKITGVDVSEKVIEFSKSKFKDIDKIDFQVQNALDLDFPDESFSTVTISNSLHHFKEPDKALSEMFRVLKKKGHLIVSEMHSDDDQSEAQQTHTKLHYWWSKIDTLNGVSHYETFTSNKLVGLVKDLNLNIIGNFIFSYPSQNPKNRETLARINDAIEMYIKRIPENSSDRKQLIEEGESLRSRVKDVGFEPAGRVFVLAQK